VASVSTEEDPPTWCPNGHRLGLRSALVGGDNLHDLLMRIRVVAGLYG
jgi:hypothetical protein